MARSKKNNVKNKVKDIFTSEEEEETGNETEENCFEVEKILDKKYFINEGQFKYYIKWKGYSE